MTLHRLTALIALAVNGLVAMAGLVDRFRLDPVATAAWVDSIVDSTPQSDLPQLLLEADSLYFATDAPEHCEALFALFGHRALDRLTDELERETLLWKLNDICAVNAEGTLAADINMRLASGHDVTLGRFMPGTPLVLFIYDPMCRHCLDTMRELKDIPAKVLALCTQASYETWQDTRPGLPPHWTAAFDLDDLPQTERFVLRSMPQVYLLDAERNVVLKNPSLTHLMQRL